MMKPSAFRAPLFLLSILIFASVQAFGQGPNPKVEASYELVLQLVVGSNDGGEGAPLPANIRSVSSQLKNNFGFSNYRLDSTYIGRIAANGSFEYKGLSSSFGADPESSSFLEWTVGRLLTSADDKGQSAFQIQPFRFGARVPVRISTVVDGGKSSSVVNYEAIGLTANQVSLAQNNPTLIGTLSLPKTAGTIFLVLTVKPAV